VNLAFSQEEEAFRAQVRECLADFRDLDGFFGQGLWWPRVAELFRAFGRRGWLSLTWPAWADGRGLPIRYEYLLWDEVAYARAARPPLSAGIVAKTLLRHGSEEQRRRWLPPIQSGDLHFSLGYSEPEAGSDLASLRTRAERRDDVYVVRGQKCWQSYAGDMHCLWLLARTGTQESRGAGLSLFVVPLDAPGVRVGPLPTLDGDRLYEVHLEDVEVPVGDRVGPEHGAWKIMAEALADERHVQFPPGRLRRDLEDVVACLRERGLAGDAHVRHVLADLGAQVFEAEMHALLVLDALGRGRAAVAEAAANKVFHTTVCQNVARAALDLGGPEAVVHGARVELLWRQSLWETIGGGTSEIMRGVVAKQALGLGGRT
jgi:alkylation response protein AidB-like acyl-CoA dehydrogenase